MVKHAGDVELGLEQQPPAPPPPAIYGNSARQRELEELILKLDLLEKECVQEQLHQEKEALKDDFVALKRQLYRQLMELKEQIRSRHAMQRARGNTVDVIRAGAAIEKGLRAMDQCFAQITDVFKRQLKQKGRKYTEEVLDRRFQELQLIKQQIEESRKLFKNPTGYTESEIKTLTDFQSQMRSHGVSQQEWRDLNAEEKGVLERWKQKDAEIDAQLLELGDAIDRLGEVAVAVGEKADKQAELVAGLHQQADEANQELQEVNNRIRELLLTQNGMNLVCKLVLSFVLVGLIGFIISLIKNRIMH